MIKHKLCKNCGCELASDEIDWCDACNLPEQGFVRVPSPAHEPEEDENQRKRERGG